MTYEDYKKQEAKRLEIVMKHMENGVDFIDIYQLLQHYSLEDLLAFYSQKYPNYSLFRALLSLNYFDDADPQAMPKMFIPTSWEEMKKAISAAVNNYQKR